MSSTRVIYRMVDDLFSPNLNEMHLSNPREALVGLYSGFVIKIASGIVV
jgi:hypothetical protein